ncbi:hypothetical protein QMO56_13705 [Roseomonas sp. E05]|uniref:hypothetical protein n=1 Tax=Roseomonas sp. E05 TaxID=3046310 RepID=UPI0024BB02F0|nr:hypothetical protein [Roseomonas sp. E05]MDJ0389171.1 hypothetical protein [Roseomonas sp. E05]
MDLDNTDTALVARLAPRLRALHEANGDDWAGMARDALALLRETHRVDPRDSSGAGPSGTDTPDIPREDD